MSDSELDLALVRRVQQGDKQAFGLLVGKYQQKIMRLVSRYVRDAADCEDVTQEAFVKAYVGKTPSGLRNHYKKLVFTGKGSMPKSFEDEAGLIAYVAQTKGAVGYVSASAAGDGVKPLAVK